MTAAGHLPIDEDITIAQLAADPYPIYRRLRAQAPVIKVASVNRVMLTRAADTRFVKDNPHPFSSNDPRTPMERAFRAHTLMRKDGAEHRRERDAMAPAFAPRCIGDVWTPICERIAADCLDRLPRGETVDLFDELAAPYAARCLAHLLGLQGASADDMRRWSQTLIDGAGNFGWDPALFAVCDAANDEMDAMLEARAAALRADPDDSALSAMVNAEDPIAWPQIVSNIKIAIGGGINEPRDALCTILFGLFANPDQLAAAKADPGLWAAAFEEGLRWVAPIQVSSRLVLEDVEIRGVPIPRGEVVMTVQASANHDEEVCENGHLYDIFRPKAAHQAFGNGPHFCQGTHVARRMLVGIMLPMLFDRFPNMSMPDPDAVTFRGFAFRGPTSLPMRLA